MNANEKSLLQRIARLESLVNALVDQFDGYRLDSHKVDYNDPFQCPWKSRYILHSESPEIKKLQAETASFLRFAGLEWKDPIPPVPARIDIMSIKKEKA